MSDEKMPNGFASLIAELSLNKTEEDREKSRTRLRKEFESCDSRLNGLVRDHRSRLSNTVETCSKVIHSVSESRNKCRALKDRITTCMDLLQWNRDNIRRMWLESLQHKYAHRILGEIEEMRKIPKEVNESLINKKLEHATEVIVSSVKVLDGSLCNADALKDLRLELHHLQEKLYAMILEDLRKSLHLTHLIADHFGDTLKEVTYEGVFSNKAPPTDNHSLKELLNELCFDKAYVIVLLNCVTMMNRMPDAIEFLKEICQSELTRLIQQVSKLMCDIVEKSVDSPLFDLPAEKQHVFLVDLTENTLGVVQKVLDNYNLFFGILQPISEAHAITDLHFQIEDVYSKFQASLETFIGLYLDSRSLSSLTDSFVFQSPQAMSISTSSFFNPQSSPEDQNLTLFKFSNSCHAINLKKYSRETKTFEIALDDPEDNEPAIKPALVCRPALRNITLIYKQLKCFVLKIEESLHLNDGEQCPLYSFLSDSANLLLDQVNFDINKMLKNASANLEAWNTAPVVGGGCKYEKEILSCSVILEDILKELKNLMNCMPDYSDHFLRLLHYVILDYKDMYHRVFKQMFEEEQNILSVSWARDGDIRRLMKSFLNWRHLEDEGTADVVESPDEIRSRNKEESELLIRNLRSEDEASWEIITHPNKLSNLALLQENLIWFSAELLKFIKNCNQSQLASLQTDVAGLRKVIKEYEDFADMCLLALHLEVRARCFQHLLAFSSREVCVEGGFVRELDTAVKRLTSDLSQIDDILLPILTPKESKYVFEGLGELVASLTILIASNMNRIDETVVRQIDRNMFAMQCCLANITMARDISMERARQFIDLLKSTHEEVLDQIVEEGPRFNEQEYASVFRLISSGAAEPRREPEYYLGKLKLIFERLSANAKELPEVP